METKTKATKPCPQCGEPARLKYCTPACERAANAAALRAKRAAQATAALDADAARKARRAACKKIAKSRGCSVQAILEKHGIKRAAFDTLVYRGYQPGDELAQKLRDAGLYQAIMPRETKS